MISEDGTSGLKIVKDDVSIIPITVNSPTQRGKRFWRALSIFFQANQERLKETRKQIRTAIMLKRVILKAERDQKTDKNCDYAQKSDIG
jgi:hypothetical protein